MTPLKENDGETLQRLIAKEQKEKERRALEDQQAIEGHKELERWAADRVKPWHKFQPNDYDFRSWTKGASKELLEAGCIYEYVREPYKLRCLIVLVNPARKRRNFEFYTLGGRRWKRSCSFEGLGEEDAGNQLCAESYKLSLYPIWISGGTSGFINDAPPSA